MQKGAIIPRDSCTMLYSLLSRFTAGVEEATSTLLACPQLTNISCYKGKKKLQGKSPEHGTQYSQHVLSYKKAESPRSKSNTPIHGKTEKHPTPKCAIIFTWCFLIFQALNLKDLPSVVLKHTNTSRCIFLRKWTGSCLDTLIAETWAYCARSPA